MKKCAIFLCVLLLLLGCTACNIRLSVEQENPSSQSGGADASSNTSGLGQEITVDGDAWEELTSSGEFGDNTVILGGEDQTSETTTSSDAPASSSVQTGTSSTSSKNVLYIDGANVSRNDEGYSPWK